MLSYFNLIVTFSFITVSLTLAALFSSNIRPSRVREYDNSIAEILVILYGGCFIPFAHFILCTKILLHLNCLVCVHFKIKDRTNRFHLIQFAHFFVLSENS